MLKPRVKQFTLSNGEKFELKLLACIILISLTLGQLVENTLLVLLAGLLGYLAWHLYQLLRLTQLIRRHRRLPPPFPPGLWGEIYQALTNARTSGRKGKKALVDFATRFREAAANIPDGLIVLDQNQRIEWSNTAASTLLNILNPEDEGKRILDLLRYPFLEEYLSAADFSHPLEFPSPDNSGLVIALQIITFGKQDRQQLLVVRDTTDVFNLSQMRKDFVANVSHELRTPLTVISASVENMIDMEKLPKQERPLLLVQQQSQRMESTITDLLALSQLEVDQQAQPRKPIAVTDLLIELIDAARNLSGNQKHQLLSEIDSKLGLIGNESQLRSAFSNLIFNAVKHTPPRSEIRISWEFTNNKARFTVKDSGEGIIARHIPRLTERFYRVDKGRSQQSGGTGLGLAIVKHVIAQHGGELHIQSKVGLGSTFSCDFPAGMFCLLPNPGF